jgi:hypothetical protein
MAYKTGDRLGTITDIVVWTIVSGAILLAAYGLVSVVLQSAAVLVMTMVFPPLILLTLLFILGGPAAVLIAGVRKRRLAMIVGPLLLIPILAAYSATSSWLEMRRMSRDVAALDMRDFSTASRHHNLVVMEYSHSIDCDDICQQILVQTDYSVGVPGYSSEPVIYRKISDAQCQATWDSARNIRFAGICATLQKVQTVDDALLIETPPTSIHGGNLGGYAVFNKLPPIEFSGKAFALIERLPRAKEQILGRWVAGEVRVWPFHSGPIGKNFSRKDFYSAALSLSVE